MSLKKILMKGSTRISLHERFTFLRNQNPTENRQTVHMESIRQGLFRDQQASARNRRLAQMMDRRPTVMAALKLKKRIMRQRLGQVQRPTLSVKDRLSLRGRDGLRGRVGQRGLNTARSQIVRQSRLRGIGTSRGGRGNRGTLSRSQSLNNLSRSQSTQSLNLQRTFNTGRGGARFQNRNFYNRQEFRRGGRGRGIRSRGRGGYNRNRDDFQTRRGGGFGRFNTRGQRARGGFRGRRAGRGRGRGGRPMTREELDSQLDQYMSGSKGVLDRELDSYMTQQEESWD